MDKKFKFIIDVGVGKAVENWLMEQGYDAVSIRRVNPRMTDEEILTIAAKEHRMVITMDKDFGDLIFNSKLSHGGVLLLRLEESTGDEKLEIVRQILTKYTHHIHHKFCVFKDGKLRVRE